MKMKNISIKNFGIISIFVILTSIFFLTFSFYNFFKVGEEIKNNRNKYHKSYIFIEKLEHYSIDLTDNVRYFFLTKREKYKNKYLDIYNIFKGEKNYKNNMSLENYMKKLEFSILFVEKFYEFSEKNEAIFYLEKIVIDYIENKDSTFFKKDILFGLEYETKLKESEKIINEMFLILKKDFDKKLNILEKKRYFYGILGDFAVIIVILIFIAFYFFIKNKVLKPIFNLQKIVKHIKDGNFNEKLPTNFNDEMGEFNKAFNEMLENFREKENFIKEIGNGNLEIDLEILSEHDSIGKNLLITKNNLIKNKKELEIKKIKEEKENWATKGITEFNTVLRAGGNNLKELSEKLVSKVVNYLDANQGALFVINENDEYDIFIEMISTYAYNRKRRLEKRIDLEEGLIGRCVDEKETIYLTEIPNNYIEINSGLGSENPKSLLIVPLKNANKVFGVIEIASFKEFEKHQIEFIEKIAESIASTIESVKINEKTVRLLEQAREDAETMASQEEEMRQNMEELQATQENIAKKDKTQVVYIKKLKEENKEKLKILRAQELKNETLLNALNKSIYMVEFDFDGKILFITDFAVKKLGGKKEDFLGKNQKDFINHDTPEKIEKYKTFWKDLKNGEIKEETNKIVFKKKELLLSEIYSTVFDEKGKALKVLKISYDITRMKNNEEKLSKAFEILNKESKLNKNYKKIIKENLEKELKMKEIIKEREKSLGNCRIEVKRLKNLVKNN